MHCLTESAAASHWSALVDELLRGVAHALNNRTTVLMSVADLVAANATAEARTLLPPQISKLHEIASIVHLLAGEPAVSAEALEIDYVLQDALRIMAVHPSGRGVRWAVRQTGIPRPVRAHRWVLLRALLLMCDAARASAAAESPAEVTITTGGDARELSVTLTTADSGTPVMTADAGRYAHMLGGSLSATTGRVELRVPTLAEVRRNQRESAAAAG